MDSKLTKIATKIAAEHDEKCEKCDSPVYRKRLCQKHWEAGKKKLLETPRSWKKEAISNPDMPGYGLMSTPPDPYEGEKCEVCSDPMVYKGGLCQGCWEAEREDFEDAKMDR
jgi:hypothetical protein